MNQRIYHTLIIGLCLLIFACENQEVIPPPPQISENAQALQQILDDEVSTQQTAFTSFGMSVTLISRERGIWTGVGGVSHVDVAITPDMLFLAASITKTFVAALALQLQEEGVLSLDDPVSKYFTGISVVDESATLRQLLNHSTGVFNFVDHPNYIPSLLNDPFREWLPEEVLKELVEDPNFEVGSGWSYSNTGFVLAGMIISQVTGHSLTEELRQRIFNPLSLNNTYFNQETFLHELAHIWDDPFASGEFTDFTELGFPLQAYQSIGAAAGSVISNSQDLARWGLILYGGEFLSGPSLQEMLEVNPLSFRDDTEAKYGLGTWEFITNGRVMYGHRGTKSHRSLLVYDPQSGISYAITTNRPDFEVFGFLEKIINVVEISI